MAWMLRSLLAAAGVDADVRGDGVVDGLSFDSRKAGAGDLFCCIPGERTDGHDHAASALAAGASSLVVERYLEVDAPQARVARVRDVMGPLAGVFYGRPSDELRVAAVTGTNGKTTVTFILEAITRAAGLEPGVIGTVSRRFAGNEEKGQINNPEAIELQQLLRRMCDAGVDIVAMEATSDGLVQGRLQGTSVATAGFTNLTQDHLNTHGTMKAYFDAKASLFDADYTQSAVVNEADDYGRRIVEQARGRLDVLTYGGSSSDIRCERAEVRATGTRARYATPAGALDVSTHLVGGFNIDNCMCAIGMALQLAIPADAIATGLRDISSVPGRLEPIDAGQPFLALVDYAHTPDALAKALSVCRELASSPGDTPGPPGSGDTPDPPGRLIVVFGCGGDRDRVKRPQMGEIATRLADLAIITSDNPRTEDPLAIIREIEEGAKGGGGEWRSVPDRREAIAAAIGAAGAGDVVLVAGKGHEQGQQFRDDVLDFDDRDVTRELLRGATCRP